MKKKVILLQKELLNKDELEAVQSSGINYSFSRVGLENSIVFPRYGALPFYKELERDVKLQQSELINTYEQHLYIANFEYYNDIAKFTPKTYFSLQNLPDNTKFVLKGITNSKKNLWKTHMFANNKKEATDIYFKLKEDTYLQNQEVIIREFEPLEVLEIGINDLPFTNEHRFFFYGEELIDHGFYWTISEQKKEVDQSGIDFAKKIAHIIARKVNFFVVDIAKKENGDWILIEINDGSMSGLSEIDPFRFYQNLNKLWKINEK